MHMADALLSPAVGGGMWAASAGAIAWCSKKVREELDDRRIPLMGVLGAFVFAAQMINFTIPGTGSSGHLGGGMLLAILLGPYAAFLVIASVLVVQALFFADGGLLALGCNIFNLGFFPSFVAYPLIYRPLAGARPDSGRILAAALCSAVAGLQLGAFAVVLETVLSGISALPFATFMLMMQPIHLAIGIVEGLVTAAVVTFVWKARPEVLSGRPLTGVSLKQLLCGLTAAAVMTGGILSWFASSRPDGLEWSIARVTGSEEGLAAPESTLHRSLSRVQEKSAVLPDYGFKAAGKSEHETAGGGMADAGASVSGLVGGLLTLVLALLGGVALKAMARRGKVRR